MAVDPDDPGAGACYALGPGHVLRPIARERLVSEADLQRAVLDLARLHRLRVHHCRPARHGERWATPITGHRGFPDLVIVGRGGVLWAELKSQTGRLSVDQVLWAETLTTAGQTHVTWRPSDLADGTIAAALAALGRPS